MQGMGRETKILLGLLGMLAFVFLGALVARLFVARPPVGLGVDVHANVAVSSPAAIVEPPELGRPGRSAFAATAAVDDASEPLPPAPVSAEPVDAQNNVAAQNVGAQNVGAQNVARDTAVVPAVFQEPAEIPQPRRSSSADRAIREGTTCTVVEGDAWWGLAEAAYGDGRWHRGLYAWNRAIDPAVSLRPGTTLAVPTAAELAAAYPGLVPARGQSGLGQPALGQTGSDR